MLSMPTAELLSVPNHVSHLRTPCDTTQRLAQQQAIYSSVFYIHKLTWFSQSSTNVVIILGMIQVAKKVPFDDPNVLNAVRGLYILSNVIIMGIFYYIKLQVDKKKGVFTTTEMLLHYQY